MWAGHAVSPAVPSERSFCALPAGPLAAERAQAAHVRLHRAGRAQRGRAPTKVVPALQMRELRRGSLLATPAMLIQVRSSSVACTGVNFDFEFDSQAQGARSNCKMATWTVQVRPSCVGCTAHAGFGGQFPGFEVEVAQGPSRPSDADPGEGFPLSPAQAAHSPDPGKGGLSGAPCITVDAPPHVSADNRPVAWLMHTPPPHPF